MLNLTLLSETEISLTRVFSAPRDLVFKTMTDPAHIPNWWGPHGHTTVVDKMDLKVGGEWRYISTGPRGSTGFRGKYLEIVPPDRIVYTFEWEGMPGHVSTETVTFEERDGKTTLLNRVKFTSIEDRDGMINSGMEKGAAETMDRLAALVEGVHAR